MIELVTAKVTTFEVVTPVGWIWVTSPAKILPGKAAMVKETGSCSFTLPTSASLTLAVTCRSSSVASVMIPPVALVALVVTAPPVIHWPTVPLIAVTVPSIGAVRVAPSRLFWAVLTATWALATAAAAASTSALVGGALVVASEASAVLTWAAAVLAVCLALWAVEAAFACAWEIEVWAVLTAASAALTLCSAVLIAAAWAAWSLVSAALAVSSAFWAVWTVCSFCLVVWAAVALKLFTAVSSPATVALAASQGPPPPREQAVSRLIWAAQRSSFAFSSCCFRIAGVVATRFLAASSAFWALSTATWSAAIFLAAWSWAAARAS